MSSIVISIHTADVRNYKDIVKQITDMIHFKIPNQSDELLYVNAKFDGLLMNEPDILLVCAYDICRANSIRKLDRFPKYKKNIL